MKTDGEPAIAALQRTVAAQRQGITKPENPPANNPSSNGACEKAVQDVSNLVRTLKLAIEARVGIAIDDDRPVVGWIIEHAAFLLSRFAEGRDGMTPIERLTGRKWTQAVAEFGEIVAAKLALSKVGRKRGAQKNKLAARFIKTVWVGQVARTGERIVMKENGDAVRYHMIRRVPIKDRWNAEDVLNVMGDTKKSSAISHRFRHSTSKNG